MILVIIAALAGGFGALARFGIDSFLRRPARLDGLEL